MGSRHTAAVLVLACLVLWVSGAAAQLPGPSPAPSSANWTGLKWPQGWSTFPSVAQPSFDYAEALHKAFIYLRIQRSGNIDTPDQHIAWRGKSCQTCMGPQGEDLSGGYYEAGGSYLKVGLPESFPITELAWTILRHRNALVRVGLADEALSALKWGTDYLLNCHNFGANSFVAVLGDPDADFEFYGPPEDWGTYVGQGRPVAYTTSSDPASEITAEAAAALAAASIVFNTSDAAFAGTLLNHSMALFDLASDYPGSYMNSTNPGLRIHAELYPSTGYHDELAWAAVWLYKATGDGTYLTAALNTFDASQADGNVACCGYGTFSWDTKSPGVAFLLAELMPTDLEFDDAIQQFCNWYLQPFRTVPHTANGLAYPYKGWGALRYATNAAALTMQYAALLLESPYCTPGVHAYAAQLFNYGKSQIDFALGSTGRSYLVGFGARSPRSPFQKDAWNSWLNYAPGNMTEAQIRNNFLTSPQPNRFTAYGALVGGPDSIKGNAYTDSRDQTYQFSEPSLDYQGGLILALGALVDYHAGLGPFDECGLDFGYSFPGAPPPPPGLVAACGAASVAAGAGGAAPPPRGIITLPGNATGPGDSTRQ